jgi:hypothetical protein
MQRRGKFIIPLLFLYAAETDGGAREGKPYAA